LSEQVVDYVKKHKLSNKIILLREEKLLGTGGTLVKLLREIQNENPIFFAHADNFTDFDIDKFYKAHLLRPKICGITMMTFVTDDPESCGVVSVNEDGVVVDFHEKSNKFFNFSSPKDKGIKIDGIDNVMVGFGKCCNPIPGDNLIGFITRGRGVTVHHSHCKNLPLINHEMDRLVSLEWNVKSSDQFDVDLKVVGQDFKGWLKELSECIAKQNININSVDIRVNDSIAEAKFIVEVNNNRQLARLIRKIKKLTNVDYVERIGQS
jgi:predicted amino acid-binding ACT domain protein